MTRRLHILIAGCAAAVAVAEWLHGNAGSWAWTAGVAGLATAGLAVVRGPRTIASGLAALASLLLGVVVVAGVREVRRIECCWTEVRAELVPRDSAELRGALVAAVAEARRLAARGMRAALLPRDAAFEQLEVAMEARGQAPGVERGVVILGADGEPVAWAGRHRFVPTRDTVASSDTLRAVITPFYVSLEARRQTQAGGTAVGSVLIDAAPAARDRDGAVSALFARRHGVTLRFYAPRLAPADSNFFDYATPDGRTLFSVQLVPPSQGDAKLDALHGVAGRAGAALAATLLFLFVAAPPGRWRASVMLAAAWCLLRAPLGPSLPRASLFSPAVFYRPMLGVFSASAGSLAVLGLVLLLAASVLWRRGGPRPDGTVPGALPRSGHRAARRRRELRAVGLVGGRGGSRQHGARALGRGAGAWHRGGAGRAMDPPSRLRVGRACGARRSLAVATVRRLARVVHVRLAPGARGRGGTGAESLGGKRHRHRWRHGRRARHLGRGGRRPPRSRRA